MALLVGKLRFPVFRAARPRTCFSPRTDWHGHCTDACMAAVDYLLGARKSLDALAELLADAAEEEKPVSEIAAEALVLLNDVRDVLSTLGDEEGTE